MYRFAVIALAACSILAAPTLASAEENFSIRVKTNDLDLQSESGAKTALDRIMKEAKKACTPEVEVGTRIPHVDATCLNDISARLVQRLGSPNVQAAYDARKPSVQG